MVACRHECVSPRVRSHRRARATQHQSALAQRNLHARALASGKISAEMLYNIIDDYGVACDILCAAEDSAWQAPGPSGPGPGVPKCFSRESGAYHRTTHVVFIHVGEIACEVACLYSDMAVNADCSHAMPDPPGPERKSTSPSSSSSSETAGSAPAATSGDPSCASSRCPGSQPDSIEVGTRRLQGLKRPA